MINRFRLDRRILMISPWQTSLTEIRTAFSQILLDSNGGARLHGFFQWNWRLGVCTDSKDLWLWNTRTWISRRGSRWETCSWPLHACPCPCLYVCTLVTLSVSMWLKIIGLLSLCFPLYPLEGHILNDSQKGVLQMFSFWCLCEELEVFFNKVTPKVSQRCPGIEASFFVDLYLRVL